MARLAILGPGLNGWRSLFEGAIADEKPLATTAMTAAGTWQLAFQL
jgi:hypothetical protein